MLIGTFAREKYQTPLPAPRGKAKVAKAKSDSKDTRERALNKWERGRGRIPKQP